MQFHTSGDPGMRGIHVMAGYGVVVRRVQVLIFSGGRVPRPDVEYRVRDVEYNKIPIPEVEYKVGVKFFLSWDKNSSLTQPHPYHPPW